MRTDQEKVTDMGVDCSFTASARVPDKPMDLSSREVRRLQGERMKQAAHDAGLTLDDLARQIGCSRALIYQYASGASIAQSERLQQIAQAVGKPLAWFFQDEGEAGDEPSERGAFDEAAEKAQLQAERDRLAA